MQNPAPSGAGFSDVTDTGDLLTFPLDRRCADTLRAQIPHLQPEGYFLFSLRRRNSARLSGVTDTGDFFTFPLDRRCADTLRAQIPHLQPEGYFLLPLRRRNSAKLSGVTDTGDFLTFPLDRRHADALSAPTSKNVHGSSLPCTFSICFCPRLRRGRRVPGSGCAAARGRGP